MQCINCGREFTGEQCPTCGYRVVTERFSPKLLWKEILRSFDLERGLYQTSLKLITNPGPIVHDYIVGKRVLYGPIKFLFVTGALATFLGYKFNIFVDQDNALQIFGLPDMRGFAYYSGKYFSLTNFVGIPIFTLFTWLFFRKLRFNYIEHLVLNTYIAGGQFLIVILMSPILIPFHTGLAINLYALINIGYNVIALVTFFKLPKIKSLIVSLVAMICSFASTFLVNYYIFEALPASWLQFLDS